MGVADVEGIEPGDELLAPKQFLEFGVQRLEFRTLLGVGLVDLLEREDALAQLGRLAIGRPLERKPPSERVAHGAPDVEVGGRATDRKSGTARLAGGDFLQGLLDQVRQLEVLEEDVEELVARKHEGEIVLALAVGRPLAAAAPAGAARRLGDLVAGAEVLVAGQDPLAPATLGRVVEMRLLDAVGRHGDRFATVRVGYAALANRLIHRPLHIGADTTDEAAAVPEAFVLRVQAAVYEIDHRVGPLTPPC